MRRGLRLRLALTHALVALLAIAVVALIVFVVGGRRFDSYLTQVQNGRNAAVVDLTSPLGHFKFSGYFAWLFWLFAHIYFLIGFRNRIVVLMDWAAAYWSKQRYARVVTHIEAPIHQHDT